MGKITDQNQRILRDASDYKDADLRDMADASFSEVLNQLIQKKEVSTQTIVNKTGISKSYINKLRNFSEKTPNPGRFKIINIGLAMDASLEEINTLLKVARLQPLYARNKAESIIIWGLLHELSGEAICERLYEEGFGSLFGKY